MKETAGLRSKPCRSVTSEEVDHLHELGWVKLKSFVDPDVVRAMLDLAREIDGRRRRQQPNIPIFGGGCRRWKARARLLQRSSAARD